MRMPHSSVIPDYSGGFSELREVTDNIMDPSNPVDVGLMGLGMAPIPGARVPIGLRALSKAAQYILQNGLGKARRLFPKGAIDDAVVELGKRESQIIKKSKEARDYKKSDYMKDAREGLRRKERNKRSQDLMTKKDPDYYLDDYPVEKPLGFAGGGMPTIMMNPDMPVMRFQRGGMPRSPLMMQEPFIPQRPPRMFINDEVPTNDFVPFSEREGFGELPSEFMPPPPRKQFLQRPPSIEEERPPMQYIGEGAPRMGMPPEMPQFPGRQPKFPGMESIRDPEPVGPPPGMPPLTPMPIVEETLEDFVPLSERGFMGPIKEDFGRNEIRYDPFYLDDEGNMQRYKGPDRKFIEEERPDALEPFIPPDIQPKGESLPQDHPFFQSPEYLNFQEKGGIGTMDMYQASDGTQFGSGTTGKMYERWLANQQNGTGTTTPPEPPMPPDVLPGEPEQTAQPTQDQFMERLMQMIQGLQERRQPAPQPAQQMAPPPPRPPATPFNMGNSGMSGGAPTMPQMFNQGPGFFTPQQRGPKIAPGAIAQQTQELMPNYNLDFSSFLRNR